MSILPILRRVQRAEETSLPPRQVFDQRDVNCCFSCALASAMEARDPEMPPLAPLYHFHLAGGEERIETGLTLAEAKLSLLRNGICALEQHRFEISRSTVGEPPTDDAIRDGAARKPMDPSSGTLLWRSVSSTDPERSWKRVLADGAPIVIGFQPNADYLALTAQQPMLTANEGPYSSVGHAAVVIGYRNQLSAFVIQDSRRGTAFGAGGQWFLPYTFATSPFVVLAIALARVDD